MSKYVSLLRIRESIQHLERFNVFFGTTFLVLKRQEVPVGATVRIALDAENREHLRRYFRVHPKSDYFFIPFQPKRNQARWRDPKYASTSLQAVNTQGFSGALLHKKNEKDWGWAPHYLKFLSGKLPRGRKLPLLHFAVWFGRDRLWDDSATGQDLTAWFVREFHISTAEITALFDTNLTSAVDDHAAFQATPPKWSEVIEGFGAPKDVPLEGGAILQFLEFTGLGPVRDLHFVPARRLNLLTGDNGLGKTFLLDVVWWALTHEWAEDMIVPLEPAATPPEIKFIVANTPAHRPATAEFDPNTYQWQLPPREATAGLVVYARVDGSFAVSDPANLSLSARGTPSQSRFVSFDRDEIWQGDKNSKIEGLLRDWVRWQTRSDEFPAFDTFQRVLQRTKPPDLGEFKIGTPVHLMGWSMEVPTLIHPYGQVPIIYESAGIRRVLVLAYLIVWAWEQHKILAKQLGRKEERQMVILLDEAEAHLHPRWQRVLLPALLGIAQDLHHELEIQYFVASHSPLVLASAEPVWDADKDSLFHLRLNAQGKVLFDRIPFELRGTSDAWLQSPSFDGLHPGSAAAERALQRAKALLEKTDVTRSEVTAASEELAEHIAADDPFWLRWILFAAQHDVPL